MNPFYKSYLFRFIFLFSIIVLAGSAYFITPILSISNSLSSHFNVSVGDIGLLGSLDNAGWIISLFTTQILIQKFGINFACLVNLLIQSLGCLLSLYASYQKSFAYLQAGMFLIGIGDVFLIVNRI